MSKLNGSVERLAEALRDVVREGAAEAVAPTETRLRNSIHEEVQGLREELTGKIDRAVENIIAERQTERSS